jgi:integrase
VATYSERISKKGKKTIKVQIRLKGMSKPISFTAPNMTTAKKVAEQKEADIRAGRLNPEETRHTVADLIDAYLSEVLPLAGDAPRWAFRKRSVLPLWKAEIGHLKLSEVQPHHVTAYRRKRLKAGVSPATANRDVAILSAAFKAGKKELGWLRHNPCSDVERLDERGRERKRHLSGDEYQRLMDACDEACGGTGVKPETLRTIIDVALETGGRRSKVEGLRWPNVNLSWSTLGQDGDIGSVTFIDTKNGDDVVVPIAGSALDRLRTLWKEGVRRIDTDLVFPREDGTKPIHTRRAFDKALELSEVNQGVVEKLVFHSLRHTTGTMILEAGGSTRDVMEMLGQRTELMGRRYAHATGAHKQEIARRLAERKRATT